MPQTKDIRWTLIYLAQGFGLCVTAVAVFVLIGNWGAASLRRAFDAAPTCRVETLLHSTATTGSAHATECQVERLAVSAEHHSRGGRGNPLPSITVLLPSGHPHSVRLTRSDVIGSIRVGEQIEALVFANRVAFIAVNGQAISTSDNPDVAHDLTIVRVAVCALLLGLALSYFYRAWISVAKRRVRPAAQGAA